jgi:hypothetical protein
MDPQVIALSAKHPATAVESRERSMGLNLARECLTGKSVATVGWSFSWKLRGCAGKFRGSPRGPI